MFQTTVAGTGVGRWGGCPLEAPGMLRGAGDWKGREGAGQWAQNQGGIALYRFGSRIPEGGLEF